MGWTGVGRVILLRLDILVHAVFSASIPLMINIFNMFVIASFSLVCSSSEYHCGPWLEKEWPLRTCYSKDTIFALIRGWMRCVLGQAFAFSLVQGPFAIPLVLHRVLHACRFCLLFYLLITVASTSISAGFGIERDLRRTKVGARHYYGQALPIVLK
jgi:predicted membrane channel-forming protein YqfA (hemolysin III family)